MTTKNEQSPQKKAAETRKQENPQAFSEMGKKGAEARHGQQGSQGSSNKQSSSKESGRQDESQGGNQGRGGK